MNEPTLFELEAPEWVPVIRDLTPEVKALLERFAHGGVLPTDDADWKAWKAGERCSECGGLMSQRPWARGCGGATHGVVCDDCAALDGLGRRRDPAEADVSRWGIRTTPEKRERLQREQASRRAVYLLSPAVVDVGDQRFDLAEVPDDLGEGGLESQDLGGAVGAVGVLEGAGGVVKAVGSHEVTVVPRGFS